MDKEITVQIRSPSLNETLNIQIPFNESILSLKKIIQNIHPQHPSSSNQRIIFSGKLLQDSDVLNEVIKKIQEGVVPTFHLVVKPSLQSVQKNTSTEQTNIEPNTQLPTQTTTTNTPITTLTSPQYHPHINQNSPLLYPPLPGGYQVIAINGQYYLAPVLTITEAFNPTAPVHQHTPNNTQIPNNPAFVPPVQQQQQPFFRMNGFVRQVNNVQRATSIWLALKIIVVLFMVCQGASIERIFIFHLIGFVFFLYQTGRLRVVFRRVRPIDLNRRRPNPTIPSNQTGNNTNQTNPEPVREPTTLDVIKRGMFAFVASLWPNYGVDPRIAQAFENENNNE